MCKANEFPELSNEQTNTKENFNYVWSSKISSETDNLK